MIYHLAKIKNYLGNKTIISKKYYKKIQTSFKLRGYKKIENFRKNFFFITNKIRNFVPFFRT